MLRSRGRLARGSHRPKRVRGEYNKVSISGTGAINGTIKAKEIKVSGVGNFSEIVEAELIKISGVSNFQNNVKCKTFYSSGASKIQKDLLADSVTINGAISIQGDINSDVLVVDTKESKFNNIYGDCINIKSSDKVTVNEIEATAISLVNVTANKVSGNKLEIFGYSNIDTIEYSESLIIHNTCKVKNIIKL